MAKCLSSFFSSVLISWISLSGKNQWHEGGCHSSRLESQWNELGRLVAEINCGNIYLVGYRRLEKVCWSAGFISSSTGINYTIHRDLWNLSCPISVLPFPTFLQLHSAVYFIHRIQDFSQQYGNIWQQLVASEDELAQMLLNVHITSLSYWCRYSCVETRMTENLMQDISSV